MQKIVIILSLLLIMQGCSNKAEIINTKNLKEIIIMMDSSKINSHYKELRVTHADSLMTILAALNNCDEEPIKFYPTHKIKLIYGSNEEQMILCSGRSMKYKGQTYKLEKNLKDVINL